MADQDTEITLGTGRLLGLFFGLVVICGMFFVAGYTLGKSAVAQPATDSAIPAPVPTTTTAKPSPTRQDPVKLDCASTPEGCAPAATQTTATQATAPELAAPATPPVPAAAPATAPATAADGAKNAATSYTVQVAAVSKQQDAEALAAALKKKNYAVSVVTPVSDNLFHVQIGPFSDPKEAEATRARLLSDGYNPIVKR